MLYWNSSICCFHSIHIYDGFVLHTPKQYSWTKIPRKKDFPICAYTSVPPMWNLNMLGTGKIFQSSPYISLRMEKDFLMLRAYADPTSWKADNKLNVGNTNQCWLFMLVFHEKNIKPGNMIPAMIPYGRDTVLLEELKISQVGGQIITQFGCRERSLSFH